MSSTELKDRLEKNFATFADPSSDRLADLLADYADDAVFEDPFQVVRGKRGVEKAFRAMIRAARSIHVVTSDSVASGDRIWLAWRFDFTPRRGPTITVEGATLFRLRDGKVVLHRDYWDTVETLGLTFPTLKTLTKRALGLRG